MSEQAGRNMDSAADMTFEASSTTLDPSAALLKERASVDSRPRQTPLTFQQRTSTNPIPKTGVSAETALAFDIADYRIYLFYGPFESSHFSRFRQLVEEIRMADRVNFEFVPSRETQESTAITILWTFREWTRWTRKRVRSYHGAGSSGHERYVAAVAAYAEMLRMWPDELSRYLEMRDEVARIQRRALNDELDIEGTLETKPSKVGGASAPNNLQASSS
jgi:hypothetical protein